MISPGDDHRHLYCGTGSADITPPLDVGYLTSSVKGTWKPFESVRTSLLATALWIEMGEDPVAIVSLDLLGLTENCTGGWTAFKHDIAHRVTRRPIKPHNIIISCSHTHSSPETLSLSDLESSPLFQSWMQTLKQRIAEAINAAAAAAQPAVFSYGDTFLPGYSLQRRIPTPEGIVLSDALQPPTAEMLSGQPVDHRVRLLHFAQIESGVALATIIHAVCHPVHEMCLTAISADYPGEMREALSRERFGTILFLNGAAGDINPISVSEGAGAARAHGRALANAVEGASQSHLKVSSVKIHKSELVLPTRLGTPPEFVPCTARIIAMQMGEITLVFLPGEPFLEIALEIERGFPGRAIIVAGYCENSIGYIPTASALGEGGYEVGPGKWSYLAPGSDESITRLAAKLVSEME